MNYDDFRKKKCAGFFVVVFFSNNLVIFLLLVAKMHTGARSRRQRHPVPVEERRRDPSPDPRQGRIIGKRKKPYFTQNPVSTVH